MKRRTLIVLGTFAVLLALGLAIRESRVSMGVRGLELPKLDNDQVTVLELSGARNFILRKEGNGWTVVDPARPEVKYRADENEVNTVLVTLREMTSPDFVTAGAEKLAEYGLDDAGGLKLKVVHGGGAPLELVVGKDGEDGGTYLRKPGGKDVFWDRQALGFSLRKELKDWRGKQLLTTKVEDLARLVVRSKDGRSVTLEAGASPTEWSLAEGTTVPPGFRFSADIAYRLAHELTHLWVWAFLEGEAASDAVTGLGEAHDSVEAQLKDGKKVVLHVGREPERKVGWWTIPVRLEGSAEVYGIEEQTSRQFRRRLEDFRDLSLFRFDSRKVTRLKLQAEGETVVVMKEGGKWRVAEPRQLPEGFELDPALVHVKLTQVSHVHAMRIIEEPVPDAQTGFASPSLLVEVTVEGEPVHTLRVGKRIPGTGEGWKEFHARGSIDTLHYVVDEIWLSQLPRGLESFRFEPRKRSAWWR